MSIDSLMAEALLLATNPEKWNELRNAKIEDIKKNLASKAPYAIQNAIGKPLSVRLDKRTTVRGTVVGGTFAGVKVNDNSVVALFDIQLKSATGHIFNVKVTQLPR